VRNGITGFVVAAEQPDELCSVIESLFSRPEFAVTAGKTAQHIVKEEFTALYTTAAYANLYRQSLQTSAK
jgi:hypothetical protein